MLPSDNRTVPRLDHAMRSIDSFRLPGRALSRTVHGPDGEPAILIESLVVEPGHRIVLTFEAIGPRWRQGVLLATEGRLVAADTSSPSLAI